MQQKQIIYKKPTTITRIGYCPLCEKEEQPKTGKLFTVYSKGIWYGKYAIRNGIIGYTPHIYTANFLGANVQVFIRCAIYECGFVGYKFINYINDEKEFELMNPKFTHQIREIWTIKQWEDLFKYTHDFDYDI